jgi:nitrate/nitrite transporter NarK
VPFSVALASGSVVWLLLTWLGFSYTEAWIWFIAMLVMPVATWFTANYLQKVREVAEATKLAELRLRGKA